ncbi:unnamed protein product [Schistosoma turkestanicum]|nr:unnamed protein product [Schistosoma turkestanicum]
MTTTVKLSSFISLIIFHSIIQFMKYLPKVYSVKGCVTFVYGDDYSMRQSICDKLNTHFQTIPMSLPSEVVKLTINHQDITSLNASQLIHLPNLTFLNLDSNKIKSIHPNTFNHLIRLQTLSLRYNLLTISFESFHPNVIHGLIMIQHINLLHNPIGNIPNHFFLPIGKTLRSIVLSEGSIDLQLNPESFYGLYKLQLLDLSNNQLESLPDTYERVFSQMQLEELYLHGNPWKCDCHLRWLKQWFLKYHTKLIYSKPINEAILRHSIDTEANNWLVDERNSEDHVEMNKLLQPKCASPIGLHGKPLFSQISNVGNTQAVRSVDFHCSPESHTPDQQIQLVWGSNSTMSCKFFADPSGIVVWYKDGTRIQNHWPRTMTKQSQGYGHVNTTFNVQVIGGTSMDESFYHNGVFYWISKLDTTLVLKYTGMIAACLIILLVIMGLLIYLFNGKMYCRPKLCINKTIPTYDNRSDQSQQVLGDELETMNTSNFSMNNGKNTNDHSRSTYMIQGQNLNICTPKDGNLPVTTYKRSELNDHVYLHGTSDNVLDQHNLLSLKSHDPTFDNYVTVRLLPTVTCSNFTVPCPIHNYAFIRPVSTDSTTVSAATNVSVNYDGVDAGSMQITPESHIISLSNLQKYDPIENANLTTSISNTKISNASEENDASKNHKVTNIDSNNIDNKTIHNNDNHCLNTSVYTPCPLHGNIYATLQSKEKKNISAEIRKHIANVPSGLTGLTYEKHYTLPNKKFRTQLSTPTTITTITTTTVAITSSSSTSNHILRTNTTQTINSVTSSLMNK